MKTFYVIEGLDLLQYSRVRFNPDPGLFETEEEAQLFCKRSKSDTIAYAYRAVRLGHMDTKGANDENTELGEDLEGI